MTAPQIFGLVIFILLMIGALILAIFSLKGIIKTIKTWKQNPKPKKLTRKQLKQLQRYTQEEQQANATTTKEK